MTEKRGNFWRERVGKNLVEKCYKVEISDKSKQKIEEIKNKLEERPDLNVVIYFNHVAFGDPLLAGHVGVLIDPENTRKMVAPVSYSHTEPKLKNIPTLAMTTLVKIGGVETHGVVQNYQKDLYEDHLKINKKFLNRLKELKNKNISTCMLISPEGHRSDNGALIKGEEGMALSGRILAPTIFVPVGVIYEDGFKRNSVNFGKKVILNVGEIHIIENNEKDRDLFPKLMGNLADALPVEMRGVYGKDLNDIPDTRK